jgi:hypothetical protein
MWLIVVLPPLAVALGGEDGVHCGYIYNIIFVTPFAFLAQRIFTFKALFNRAARRALVVYQFWHRVSFQSLCFHRWPLRLGEKMGCILYFFPSSNNGISDFLFIFVIPHKHHLSSPSNPSDISLHSGHW